jgi:D-alanine-D-alanine ligase
MQNASKHKNLLKAEPYFIWVLAPQLDTDDPNLKHYYDFDANIAEFTKAFDELNMQWKWQYVTINNYKKIIDHIAASANGHIPLVFNLCDGDEVNGAPGLSVIKYLEEKGLIYTGAREVYYYLTTSKITMKQAFDRAGIPHAPWLPITGVKQELAGFCNKTGTPLIIKPAVSGGSMGLGVKNVVNSDEELSKVVHELYEGYHGWDFTFGGLVAEKFITGPEFTTFIVGSYNQPEQAIIYQPVERIFNNRLPEHEKFLSFDRLWETYEDEQPCGNGVYEDFYNYNKPEPALLDALCKITWDAFCAVEGTGYGRIDIRMDKETGDLFILEVNAQCGLSEDENYTSIGAMVRLGTHSFSDMVRDILENALLAKMKPAPAKKKKVSAGKTRKKRMKQLR